MADLVDTVRESLGFVTPQYLVVVPVALLLFLFGLIVYCLMLRGRPLKTRGSSYPLVGHIKFWFVAILVLALMAIAAARPYLVSGVSSFKRGATDVVVALDASASMWVKDLNGDSRLSIAVREIMRLDTDEILKPGDRTALFVFGGTAIRKVHLSSDLARFIAEAGRVAPPPTLTGDAFPWDSDIATAMVHVYQSLDNQDRFEAGEDDGPPEWRSDRLVLLFTDGDLGDLIVDAAQMQRLDEALVEFERRGLTIYPIGIGSRQGRELIEILRDYERGRDYDDMLAAELQGQRTRLRDDVLTLLEQRTGGKSVIISNNTANASAFLRDAVDSHRAITFQFVPAQDQQEVWQYVVMTAILIVAVAVLFY